VPMAGPTLEPSRIPTSPPTMAHSGGPTSEPSTVPTGSPTLVPTAGPTSEPTMIPTSPPTVAPSVAPTSDPSWIPTSSPTFVPTVGPTSEPTRIPTSSPTLVPTDSPTLFPTLNPTTQRNVLFVVVNKNSLTPQEQLKRDAILSWGWSVTFITASPYANYLSAAASSNVVFIGEDISSGNVAALLLDTPTGVVMEENAVTDEFQIGLVPNDASWTTTDYLNIVDNTHYITESFGLGDLNVFNTMCSTTLKISYLQPGYASGLTNLGQGKGKNSPSLVAVAKNAALQSGTAKGRRVVLPWGLDIMDFNCLNGNGRLIMRHALEWAAGSGSD